MFSENHSVYEIMWQKSLAQDRARMPIWYGACAVHAGTRRQQHRHTNIIYKKYCFSTSVAVTRRLSSAKLYISCLIRNRNLFWCPMFSYFTNICSKNSHCILRVPVSASHWTVSKILKVVQILIKNLYDQHDGVRILKVFSSLQLVTNT